MVVLIQQQLRKLKTKRRKLKTRPANQLLRKKSVLNNTKLTPTTNGSTTLSTVLQFTKKQPLLSASCKKTLEPAINLIYLSTSWSSE